VWTVILSLFGGGLITGAIVWIKQFFFNKEKIIDLTNITESATERITAGEKQAELDREKRSKELNVEATKIITTNDADAALALLRRKFPPHSSAPSS